MAGHLLVDDLMTHRARVSRLEALTRRLRAAGCVFAEEEAALLLDAAADLDQAGPTLADLVDRRIGGEPLEHLLGRVDFAGLRLRLGPGVFVPRRRSELLVTAALELLGTQTPLVVVELCCGVAAVATALTRALTAAGRSALEVHATDADPVAVRWAERNLRDAVRGRPEASSVRCHTEVAELYEGLPVRLRGRVDLLLAVPPYVPTPHLALMPAEARLHEPVAALDGGPDGLDPTRRIVAGAPGWLAPGGALLVETSAGQVDAVTTQVTSAGLVTSVLTRDEPEAVVVVGVRAS